MALAPDQSPVAVQLVALVEDQVRIEVPPFATDVGFAVSDGGVPVTVTVADVLVLPPVPVQVREKLTLAVSVLVA